MYSMKNKGGLYAELCGISMESVTGEMRILQGINVFAFGKEKVS